MSHTAAPYADHGLQLDGEACRATVRTPRSATISDTSISSRPSLTEPPSSPKPPSGGGLKGQALRGFGQGGQSETDATISVIVTFSAGSSYCRAQAGSDCRATPPADRDDPRGDDAAPLPARG